MTHLPATLSLAAAAAIHWDAVIVGAGPAGGSAAVRLARRGLRVVLVDRGPMPRGKLCGCCLSVAAHAELTALDLPRERSPLAQSVPLTRIRLATGGREAAIAVRGGSTLSREALDTALVAEAIQRGCHWLPHTAATGVTEPADAGEPTTILEVRQADAARASLACRRLILASGLGETVRCAGPAAEDAPRPTVAPHSRIGIGAVLPADSSPLPPGELVMAVARAGYCGVVRLEDGRIDIAAAVDRSALTAAEPAALLRSVLDEATRGTSFDPTLPGLEAAAIRGTPPLTRSAPLVAGRGNTVFRVGDAAGYVEPFTGEGMGWALAAGRIVAEALLAERGTDLVPAPEAARHYVRRHAQTFGRHHARCTRVAAGVRRPAMMRLAVRAAQLAPWAARLAVPAVTGGRSRAGAAS